MYEDDEAVGKVRSALDSAGCFDVNIKITEETIFTVEDASKAVGVPSEEILKSLIFLVDDNPVLVLMSGSNRVNPKKVACAAGGKKVKMATPEYVYERFGFRVGGVPPLGYPVRMAAFLDDDIFRFPTVWAAAGTEHAFFPVAPERLLALTNGVRASVKKDEKNEKEKRKDEADVG